MVERPYVTVFSTVTVDGRLASSTGFSGLSCPYDLYRLRLLRGHVEAVMVGAGTVLADNPRLLQRIHTGRKLETYYRVVVDGRLRLLDEADRLRLFRGEPENVIVFTADAQRAPLLEKLGVKVHVTGSNGVVDLARALETLYHVYGVTRLLVEGGGKLIYSLLEARLVDELRVTVAPYVFGSGVSLAEDPGGRGFPDTRSSPKLRLECYELCPCGNCMHLVYTVTDNRCCSLGSPPPRCLTPHLQKLEAKA